MTEKEKEYKFLGRIVRCVYNSDDFKVYAVDVNKNKYPEVKKNKFGNVSISGELPDLTLGVEYEIGGVLTSSKNGYSYKVLNVRRDAPKTAEAVYLFLSEILTRNQADVLFKNYPDIIERVKENRLDDIDLSKLKGIKEYTFNVIKKKIIENFCLADLVAEFQGYLNLSIIRKIYNKYSSIDVLKKRLKQNPYKCLCGLAGVGFKTADSILLDIEKVSKENISNGKTPIIEFDYDLKTSLERCLACILYTLEDNENNEGHTKMNLSELRKQVLQTVPECIDHFPEAMKSESIYYNKENMTAALKKTFDTESAIAHEILHALNNKQIVWEYDVEKYRNVDGVLLSDEQMNAVSNVCKYTVSILNGAAGCVDCDTEYFNGREWKRIADYTMGEKVLQYTKDGSAELVYPINYIKQKADYLWHFETKYGLNQTLSDKHNVYYITSKGNLFHKTMKEVRENHSQSGFKGKFITTFDWNRSGIELSDYEIRLMVAVFADGSFNYQTWSDETYTRARFRLKKERKKQRLIQLINSAGCDYTVSESITEGYTDFYVQVPFRCKHFPRDWYNCNKQQMKIIANELIYWDCAYEEKNRFFTTSKNDADFIQFVFTTLGYRATIITHNRMGNEYLTNGKIYNRKSVDYIVSWTEKNLISLCTDNREDHIKTPIEKVKTTDGFEYCFTVPSHMLVLRRKDRIFITGNCGKSMLVKAIVNMLDDNKLTYKLLTPTGKSAKVLADFTDKKTQTIHRGLEYRPNGFYYYKGNPSNQEEYDYYTHFGYNLYSKLRTDIIIVDEFSMVDIWLFKHLIDAIDFKYTKLLIIGDNAQLCSVGCGNLLHDFMESGLISTVTLTKVFRYGEGGLMKIATDVRYCKPYLSNTMKKHATTFGDNKDYTFVDLPSEIIPQHAVALYKKLLDKGYTIEDIQVLTAKNVGDCGAIVLNNALQKVANSNYGSKFYMKYGEVTYYEGDLVIQKVNNYKAERDINNLDEYEREYYLQSDEIPTAFIANGETGIIKSIYNTYMLIDFDGVIVKYTKSDLASIGLGYSISIHKSQGSSIKAVILLTPQSHIFMLNSNLIYVGLTRMKEVCFHLGTLSSVNQAVTKKANLARHTFMQDLLSEKIKNNDDLPPWDL